MLHSYPEYRETGYDWLFNVPSQWTRTPIRTLLGLSDSRCGTRTSLELLSVYREYGVIKKNSRDDNHNVESQDLSNYKYVDKGYLVMNKMKMWQGSLGISECEGIVSPAYIVCRLNTDSNLKYIHLLLRSSKFKTFFNRISYGIRVGQWDMRYDDFKKLYIYLPSRPEQDKIVSFLSWKTSEIAHFIKEKHKVISLLEELKNSLIFHAAINGVRQSASMSDCSVDWISAIPTHWDEVMLFQCAAEQSISNKTEHHQNLLSLSYGKIVNKDINTAEGLLPASFDTYQIVHDGNVILRLTDLQNDHKSLRVGLSTQTGIITSAYTCLKARDNILPEYLYYLLHAYDVSKVFYGMGGGVRQSIGYADIRRMVIPLPPMEEQREIVDYCREEQAKIEQMIAGIKDEIDLVQELRTKTISDVVTGRVDVRDVEIPQYEPESDDTIDDEEETDEDSDEDNSDAADEEVE
ncbi:restriction endonuclease subunit S [Hominenteromicrobium sp.]|uniref:restriction endonuclease subunit S n=1 Tax=Hominenteromicrobium sp. TaxID=3073581 RepID=UPI003AB1CC11